MVNPYLPQSVSDAIKDDCDPRYGRVVISNNDAWNVSTILSYDCVGIDAVDGTSFFVGNSDIWQSTDYGTTLSTGKGLPANVPVGNLAFCRKIVRFGANLYLLAKNTGGNQAIYKTPTASGNNPFTWTEVVVGGAGDTLGPCLNADTSYVYFAEYGDPAGGPRLRRSSDGTTWSTVFGPVAALRHFHCVKPDPYHLGHVWLTAGDGITNGVLYKSTDYGSSFTSIITSNKWQGVQISHTPNFVFVAGDQARGTVVVVDRATNTPRWGSLDWHGNLAVPGGRARAISNFTDGVTNGTTTFTSATAAFTQSDVGCVLYSTIGPTRITQGTHIATVSNSTTVLMNQVSASTGSAITFEIGGEAFYQNAFYGAVDPASGVYYAFAQDTSVAGTKSGMLMVPYPGAPCQVLDVHRPGALWGEVHIGGGYVLAAKRRYTLNSVVAPPLAPL